MSEMRLRFWRWAHRRAEELWHWIYYYRLPEGINKRNKTAAMLNQSYESFINNIRHSGMLDDHKSAEGSLPDDRR